VVFTRRRSGLVSCVSCGTTDHGDYVHGYEQRYGSGDGRNKEDA